MLEVGEGKQLHYTFTESLDNPEKDPLVIWFNGGPGCSSMLGFFQEHGPILKMNEEGMQITENEYTWNTRANMIYLEAPAGVGFSFTDY
jgi:cathepsin A (carboxypeptidase C)